MKKINFWKVAFIMLIAAILAFVTVVTVRVMTDREDNVNYNYDKSKTGEPSFQVKLTKNQTNELVNFYLEDFQKDSPIKYSFIVDNKIHIRGDFKLLGQDLKLYIYFQPIVLESGDVELVVESISIGSLEIPNSEVLKYVKKEYKAPDWVVIDVNKEKIFLNLKELELEKGIKVNVDKIDLLNDDITINVMLPIE